MLPDYDTRHGTNAGHNAGCRCLPCRQAKLRYDKRRRADALVGNERTVPAYRAQRRIQALAAIGWSGYAVAERAGLSPRVIHDVGTRNQRVYRETFERVADVYDDLCMKMPDPKTSEERQSVSRARNGALRRGYAPPLAWDDIDDPDECPMGSALDGKAVRGGVVDEAVVIRIMNGDSRICKEATPAERFEVARRWVEAGRAVNELARFSGWKVERYFKAAS